MHILFEKVRAFIASMPVKYSKVAAPRPSSFKIWLCYIHDNGYSILVIIFNKSVESIDSIAFYCSVCSFNEFHRIYLRNVASLFLFIMIHLFNDYNLNTNRVWTFAYKNLEYFFLFFRKDNEANGILIRLSFSITHSWLLLLLMLADSILGSRFYDFVILFLELLLLHHFQILVWFPHTIYQLLEFLMLVWAGSSIYFLLAHMRLLAKNFVHVVLEIL